MLAVETVTRSQKRFLTLENSLLLAFIVLSAIGLWHHEMWRDEAQAWLLARDSPSLIDLWRNTRYEGHPLLWHLCLFGLAKITRHPWIMQFFHWLVSIGVMLLILKASPFSKLQKGLLSVSYFLFYEYSVISRSYAMGVLLIFLFCTLYARHRPRYWLLSVVLILLANTSMFGLIISFALGTAMLYRALSEPQRPRPMGRRMRLVVPHFGLLLMGWGAALAQMLRAIAPPAKTLAAASVPINCERAAATTTSVPNGMWGLLNDLAKLAALIYKSYLPLPQLRVDFWNKHLLNAQALFPSVGQISLGLLIGMVIAIVAVLISVRLLWKTPLYLWVYAVTGVGLGSFHGLVYGGSTRHYGHLFIILLVCLWLATWSRRQRPTRGGIAPVVGHRFLTVLLICQAVAGIHAYTTDLFHPFSSSLATANYIQAHDLEDTVIFAQDNRPVAGVISYLDRRVYFPQSRSFVTFATIAYPKLEDPQALMASLETFAQQHPDFLATLNEPIADSIASHAETIQLTPLFKTEMTIEEGDRFYLYQVHSDQ